MDIFKSISFLALFVFFFSACKLDETTQKAPTSTDTPPVQEDTIKVEAPKKETGQYIHLEGFIKDIPITMHLSLKKPPIHWDWESKENYYEGFYYYNKYKEPIDLRQYIDSTGYVVLSEFYAYDEENQFIGKFETPDLFKGIWKDGYRNITFPFELKVTKPEGSIGFKNYSFSDKYIVESENPDSIGADFSLYALWPEENADSSKMAYLKREMLNIMAADSVAKLTSHPTEAYEIDKTAYLNDYKETMNEMVQDLGPEELDHSWNYSEQRDMSVAWNADDLLCLGVSWYAYTGGAHGNYGTSFHCYDLSIQKELVETDIFKGNYKSKVSRALRNSAKRTFDSDYNDYTPIDAIEMDALVPNGNFFVTGGGIGYNFVPYEIGPYALGEIRLFLPKEEIKTVLRESFIERMGW